MGKKKNKVSKPIATESVSSKKKQDAQQANKKYTFDDQTGSAAATAQDKSIIKVSLPADKVKVIIAEILRYKKETSSDGSASKRMSEKKLKDLYQALADVGFKHEQITDAMKQTVSYGGDLHTALDWLCLNLPDEELPSGLSAKLMEDEKKEKKREKWQPPPPETAEAAKPKRQRQKQPKNRVSNKDWVLKYAEEYDEDEEQEMDWLDEEEQREANAKKDPNDRYIEVSALLLDAQNAASMAKKAGNKETQKQAGKKITACIKEMAELEEHPLFEQQVKLDCLKTATPQDTNASSSQGPETKTDGSINGDEEEKEEEEGMLNMFDSMEAEAEKATNEKKEKTPAKKAEPLDVRSFEYTRQTWTGKSPKQFLIDWCRKNLPKTDPPKYEKVGAGGNKWRSRVTVDKKKEAPLVVCPDIVTENFMEAQHLASVLALWHLCRGQSIHQLLPPPYRDVWLEWKDAYAKEKEAKKSKQNKPRDQFVSQLFRQLKLQPDDRKEETEEIEETVEDSWDDTEDSWENFNDDDDEDEVVNYAEQVKEQVKVDSSSKPQQQRRHYISGHALCSIFEKRRKSKAYANMLTSRQGLPVFQHRDSILAKINREPVVIIAGETGSGKSTQIPQFLLEDLLLSGKAGTANVICTQPRRISAISLAKRVSQEMAEHGPGTRDSMVGYQIRLENRSTKTTRLLYCTTGVLLRKLQLDPLLKDVSHVIVDEVHERSVDSDFLLIILKQILQQRKDFKVILMSATIESEKMSAYFQHCPVVNIPGRTFPVQVYHLEDIIEQTGYALESDSPYAVRYELLTEQESATVTLTGKGGQSRQTKVSWEASDIKQIDLSDLDPDEYSPRTRQAITRLNPDRINMDIILELLMFLDKDPTYSHISGAVLVFMPGLANIQELNELLQSDPTFSNPNKYIVIALHSVLSSDNQSAAFDVPPAGMRKIVIATNIAETGITIPDVVFVIDTGKVKETRYNEMSQLSSLEETSISKASAKQRQGRAGRVQEGLCFRLFTKQKYDTFRGFSQPEMLRVPLEELCLHIMKCELGSPEDFLQQALDAPQLSTIRSAMNVLREVGACDAEDAENPVLTPLGHHLAALPVNVRIGKMLLFAAIFGCLEPIAVMAAAMTGKSPFVVPLGKRDQADGVKRSMAIGDSDHITIYKAYAGWREACQKGKRAEASYCSNNFLSRTSLLNIQDVKKDLMRLVKSIGFEHAQKLQNKLSANQNAQKYPEVLEISKTVSQTDTFPLSPPNICLLKAVLTAGLYPNVAMTCFIERPGVGRDPQAVCTGHTVKGGVAAHPASVNRKLLTIGYLVFLEKVKSSRVYMRDSTLVSPYPLLLFGGDLAVQHREKLVSVDDWIKFEAPARTAVIFKELRSLLSAVLAKKLREPSTQLQNEMVIQILMDLIQCER